MAPFPNKRGRMLQCEDWYEQNDDWTIVPFTLAQAKWNILFGSLLMPWNKRAFEVDTSHINFMVRKVTVGNTSCHFCLEIYWKPRACTWTLTEDIRLRTYPWKDKTPQLGLKVIHFLWRQIISRGCSKIIKKRPYLTWFPPRCDSSGMSDKNWQKLEQKIQMLLDFDSDALRRLGSCSSYSAPYL